MLLWEEPNPSENFRIHTFLSFLQRKSGRKYQTETIINTGYFITLITNTIQNRIHYSTGKEFIIPQVRNFSPTLNFVILIAP